MEKGRYFFKKYVIHAFLLCFFCLVYSYFFDKKYLVNLLSTLDGSFIFVFISLVYYLLSKRNSKNKFITSGYVIYEIIYAVLIKILLLSFLLLLSFKLFDLNNKLVIITFVYMVILRLIIYFRVGLKDNLAR